MERFLESRSADIRGRVLEIAGNTYTRRFGGSRVDRSDVLHVATSSPQVTIVADLSKGEGIPKAAFDCVILTQTLQVIYDTRATLRNLHDILRPGGVALVTFPGISKISRWRGRLVGNRERLQLLSIGIAALVCKLLILHCKCLPFIKTCGTVLHLGECLLAAEELEPQELDHVDPDYEVLISVRARRAREGP